MLRRLVSCALLVVLAGCNGWQVRPFAEAEIYAHNDPGVSTVAGGATFLSPGGASIDVGPGVQFDFMGGRTEEIFDNKQFGGVVRLRFVK